MKRNVLVITVWLTGALNVVAQTPATNPPVTIKLSKRDAHAVPTRQGFTHTGGGNIDVVQTAPDTIVISMSGVAVAGAHPCRQSMAELAFDLTQSFEIAFDKPATKRAKVTLEGRVIGLLRSHEKGGGSARLGPATASIAGSGIELLTLSLPEHSAAVGQCLSINDRDVAIGVVVGAGKFSLHECWSVSASSPSRLIPYKATSAEFAPDPALDPLWISYFEPFHGAVKKDFGFQIILKASVE